MYTTSAKNLDQAGGIKGYFKTWTVDSGLDHRSLDYVTYVRSLLNHPRLSARSFFSYAVQNAALQV